MDGSGSFILLPSAHHKRNPNGNAHWEASLLGNPHDPEFSWEKKYTSTQSCSHIFNAGRMFLNWNKGIFSIKGIFQSKGFFLNNF